MKWQVGDRVTNLDTGEKGTITAVPKKPTGNPDDYTFEWDKPTTQPTVSKA